MLSSDILLRVFCYFLEMVYSFGCFNVHKYELAFNIIWLLFSYSFNISRVLIHITQDVCFSQWEKGKESMFISSPIPFGHWPNIITWPPPAARESGKCCLNLVGCVFNLKLTLFSFSF